MTHLQQVRARINGVMASIEQLRKASRGEIRVPEYARSDSLKNHLEHYKRLWHIETEMKKEIGQ